MAMPEPMPERAGELDPERSLEQSPGKGKSHTLVLVGVLVALIAILVIITVIAM